MRNIFRRVTRRLRKKRFTVYPRPRSTVNWNELHTTGWSAKAVARRYLGSALKEVKITDENGNIWIGYRYKGLVRILKQ